MDKSVLVRLKDVNTFTDFTRLLNEHGSVAGESEWLCEEWNRKGLIYIGLVTRVVNTVPKCIPRVGHSTFDTLVCLITGLTEKGVEMESYRVVFIGDIVQKLSSNWRKGAAPGISKGDFVALLEPCKMKPNSVVPLTLSVGAYKTVTWICSSLKMPLLTKSVGKEKYTSFVNSLEAKDGQSKCSLERTCEQQPCSSQSIKTDKCSVNHCFTQQPLYINLCQCNECIARSSCQNNIHGSPGGSAINGIFQQVHQLCINPYLQSHVSQHVIAHCHCPHKQLVNIPHSCPNSGHLHNNKAPKSTNKAVDNNNPDPPTPIKRSKMDSEIEDHNESLAIDPANTDKYTMGDIVHMIKKLNKRITQQQMVPTFFSTPRKFPKGYPVKGQRSVDNLSFYSVLEKTCEEENADGGIEDSLLKKDSPDSALTRSLKNLVRQNPSKQVRTLFNLNSNRSDIYIETENDKIMDNNGEITIEEPRSYEVLDGICTKRHVRGKTFSKRQPRSEIGEGESTVEKCYSIGKGVKSGLAPARGKNDNQNGDVSSIDKDPQKAPKIDDCSLETENDGNQPHKTLKHRVEFHISGSGASSCQEIVKALDNIPVSICYNIEEGKFSLCKKSTNEIGTRCSREIVSETVVQQCLPHSELHSIGGKKISESQEIEASGSKIVPEKKMKIVEDPLQLPSTSIEPSQKITSSTMTIKIRDGVPNYSNSNRGNSDYSEVGKLSDTSQLDLQNSTGQKDCQTSSLDLGQSSSDVTNENGKSHPNSPSTSSVRKSISEVQDEQGISHCQTEIPSTNCVQRNDISTEQNLKRKRKNLEKNEIGSRKNKNSPGLFPACENLPCKASIQRNGNSDQKLSNVELDCSNTKSLGGLQNKEMHLQSKSVNQSPRLSRSKISDVEHVEDQSVHFQLPKPSIHMDASDGISRIPRTEKILAKDNSVLEENNHSNSKEVISEDRNQVCQQFTEGNLNSSQKNGEISCVEPHQKNSPTNKSTDLQEKPLDPSTPQIVICDNNMALSNSLETVSSENLVYENQGTQEATKILSEEQKQLRKTKFTNQSNGSKLQNKDFRDESLAGSSNSAQNEENMCTIEVQLKNTEDLKFQGTDETCEFFTCERGSQTLPMETSELLDQCDETQDVVIETINLCELSPEHCTADVDTQTDFFSGTSDAQTGEVTKISGDICIMLEQKQ
ncbi:hypothetical protein AAG570_000364 [Ranatra chinensis]|uniref:Uncharacterized protein n=1 Tax=Ranatra chinensis TaxID=642074 RepID=A0ABD0YWW8_9HEMI